MSNWAETGLPCPSCSSSDAFAMDVEGGGHCFSCGYHMNGSGVESPRKKVSGPLIDKGSYMDLEARGISVETCKMYDYQIGVNRSGASVHIANIYSNGKVVAQKIRGRGKSFQTLKTEDCPQRLPLFGAHIPVKDDRCVIVTEGELDAMSIAEANGRAYNVVSISGGAQSAAKDIAAAMEYLNRFDEIVLCFDMDEPGCAARDEALKVLPPKKAYYVELTEKDASACLLAGKRKELVNIRFRKLQHKPIGILDVDAILKRLEEGQQVGRYSYWHEGLETALRGMAASEIILWTGGTGGGKSEYTRETIRSCIKQGARVAYVPLEESPEFAVLCLMGMELGESVKTLADPLSVGGAREALDNLMADGRLWLVDAVGAYEPGPIFEKLDYLVQVHDVDVVVIDHLTIMDDGKDTNRFQDDLARHLRSFAQRTKTINHVVAQLRKRPSGTRSLEEGGTISSADLKGSGAIPQVCNTIVAVERDQQSEDSKNLSTLRILKSRLTGATGVAGYCEYDPHTTRLVECASPEVYAAGEPAF